MVSTKTRTIGALITIAIASIALSGCFPVAADSQQRSKQKNQQSEQSNKLKSDEQSDEPMSEDEIDLLAKLTTGTPPSDVLWHLPNDLPEGWKGETFDDEGVIQATVSSRCLIQFHQPMGLGDEAEPDSAQVALDFTKELGKDGFDTEFTVTPEESITMNAIINDGALYSQLALERVSFAAKSKPGLEGTTYALRQGDFALVATAICGDGEFATHGDQMRDYIESTSADIKY